MSAATIDTALLRAVLEDVFTGRGFNPLTIEITNDDVDGQVANLTFAGSPQGMEADFGRIAREIRDKLFVEDKPRLGAYTKAMGYEDVADGHYLIQIDLL